MCMSHFTDLLNPIRDRLRPPVAVVLGAPRQAAQIAGALRTSPITCYQMDLYQARRLAAELREQGTDADVTTSADLWDLPDVFHTVVFPAQRGVERELKLDMIEQAFHILQPRGQLLVLSPYEHDQVIPAAVKKVFRRGHVIPTDAGTIIWGRREGERPRRRHEVTFHARIGAGESLSFLSRPGVFCYGRLDDGARALLEVAEIERGARVLDLGCGGGANGIFAARSAGPDGHIHFVDSNVRAVALAAHNACANGLTAFETLAVPGDDDLPIAPCDVVLANPPYYAQATIARRFLEQAKVVLRPKGAIYVVTRQLDSTELLMADLFGDYDVLERRGYFVFHARKRR
ncbi:MAG: class I SAM-dependent methyltransferase [Gemmataceae bacterium]